MKTEKAYIRAHFDCPDCGIAMCVDADKHTLECRMPTCINYLTIYKQPQVELEIISE